MLPFNLASTQYGQVSYRQLGRGPRKILFFHGFPGSSLQIKAFEPWIQDFDLEVLCFDRPGYNQSLIFGPLKLETTVGVATEILSQKEWPKCEVFTVSGGTPAGIAFALANPDLVTQIQVMSGLGALHLKEARDEFSKLSLVLLKLLPFVPGVVLESLLGTRGKKTKNESSRARLQRVLPPSQADQEILKDSVMQEVLQGSLTEALAQKGRGPQADAKIFLSEWSLRVESLKMPIHFWHGSEDKIAPASIARCLSDRIPHSQFHLIPDEGHFSLPVRKLEDILSLSHLNSPNP